MGSSISFSSVPSGLVRAGRPVRGQALEAPRLVDHALEHALHRRRVEGPGIVAHDALQDPGLALRRVHGQPQPPLDAPDLDRAGGAAVEQAHELPVDEVDAAPPPIDLLVLVPRRVLRLRAPRHIALLSHRTWPATSPCGCSSRKRTSALPTTTPSAT